MKDEAFLDSNVLVYFFDERDIRKQNIAMELINSLTKTRTGQISTQALQEYFNVITKKLKCDKMQVRKDVENYARIFPVHSNRLKDILSAIDISIRTQFSFYDSLIIAAAKATSCNIVYSEDLNDGQMVDGIKIINPFKETV
jgi:predicted nucleic acid-binding protein